MVDQNSNKNDKEKKGPATGNEQEILPLIFSEEQDSPKAPEKKEQKKVAEQPAPVPPVEDAKKEAEPTQPPAEKPTKNSNSTQKPDQQEPVSPESEDEEIIEFRIVEDDKPDASPVTDQKEPKVEPKEEPKGVSPLPLTPKKLDSSDEAKAVIPMPLTPKADTPTESTTSKDDSIKDSVESNKEPVKAAVRLEVKKDDAASSSPVKAAVKLEAKKDDEKDPTPVKAPVKLGNSVTAKPAQAEEKKDEAPKPAPSKPQPVQLDRKNDIPKKPIHIVGNIKTENSTVGQILQDARVRYELSLNQVEQITKIKKGFVEALERDDISTLPPLVYVNAYIKTLCDLYEINQNDTALLIKKIKSENPKSPVSEEIIHHLEEEKQVNHGEELKVKRYFIIIMTLIILAVSAAIIGSLFFFKKNQPATPTNDKDLKVIETSEPKKNTVPEVKAVSYDELETLITPEIPTMNELDVPK